MKKVVSAILLLFLKIILRLTKKCLFFKITFFFVSNHSSDRSRYLFKSDRLGRATKKSRNEKEKKRRKKGEKRKEEKKKRKNRKREGRPLPRIEDNYNDSEIHPKPSSKIPYQLRKLVNNQGKSTESKEFAGSDKA